MSQIEARGESFERALETLISAQSSSLTPEQREMLSKVLFPDTDTKHVMLCGKRRELVPLPVKVCRKLHAQFKPFNDAARAAAESSGVFSVDEDLLLALFEAGKTLAEHYKWPDVEKQIDDEDIHISELQALVNVQQRLQGDNDFLLGPLRVAVKVMQAREVVEVRLKTLPQPQTKNSSTTQP